MTSLICEKKYLPLDGDGDHCTDGEGYCKALRVSYSKESPCRIICGAFALPAPLISEVDTGQQTPWNENPPPRPPHAEYDFFKSILSE